MSGTANAAAPFSPIPKIYGQRRIFPQYAASPYNELVGFNQYLRMLFLLGYGPLDISQIKIGDTAIEDYEDVEWELRSGFPDDAPTRLYPGSVSEAELNIQLSKTNGGGVAPTVYDWSQVPVQTSGTNADELGVDVSFPGGLSAFSKSSGKPVFIGCRLQIRWAPTGTQNWTYEPVFVIKSTYIGTTGAGHVWRVPRGQYDVQATFSPFTVLGDDWSQNYVADGYWTALRTIRDQPPYSMAGLALLAVRIRASRQLSGAISNLNCVAASILPDYDSATGLWDGRAGGWDYDYDNQGAGASLYSLDAVNVHTTAATTDNEFITDFVIGTGDGSTVAFANTLPVPAAQGALSYAIQPGSLIVSVGTQASASDSPGSKKLTAAVASQLFIGDDGEGNIVGPTVASGTVDYTTGALSLTFTVAPPSGLNVTADFTLLVQTAGGGRALAIQTASSSDQAAVASKSIPVRILPPDGSTGTPPPTSYAVSGWYMASAALTAGVTIRVFWGDAEDFAVADAIGYYDILAAGDATTAWQQASGTATAPSGAGAPLWMRIAVYHLGAGSGVTVYLDDFAVTPSEQGVTAFNVLGNPSFDFAGQITTNPASHYRDVLQSRANKLAVADARLDLTGLQNWWIDNDTNSRNFNGVLDSPGTVFDTLRKIVSFGRASFTMRDSLYSVVVDQPQTTPIQHFTPRNSWGFKWTKGFPNLPQALKVRFLNPANNWQVDERVVYDDNPAGGTYDAATTSLYEVLDLSDGCTDYLQAWKDGRYHLAQARLRGETFEWHADIENIVCQHGDLVYLTHDVPEFGRGAGRIASVQLDGSGNCTGITTDELFAFEYGSSYVVRIRRTADGSSLLENLANPLTGVENSASADFPGAASVTAPETSTENANDVVVTFVTQNAASDLTEPSGVTNLWNLSSHGCAAMYAVQSSAGATPAVTVDSNNSTEPYVAATIVLGNAGGTPALRGTPTSAAGGPGATVTFDVPTGVQAGDILIAQIGLGASGGLPATIAPPPGWLPVANTTDPSNSAQQAIFVHMAGGSEPASYSWQLSAANYWQGGIAAFVGIASIAAQPATVGSTASGVWTLASLVITGEDGAPTLRAAILGPTGTSTSAAVTMPSGMEAGDLIVVQLTFQGNPGTISPPTGWGLLLLQSDGADDTVLAAILYKLANDSEPSSYSFGWQNSVAFQSGAASFTNVAGDNPIESSAGAGAPSANSATTPLVAPQEPLNALIAVFAIQNGAGALTLAGATQLWAPATGLGAWYYAPSSVATGTLTFQAAIPAASPQPAAGDLVMFGILNAETNPVVITRIEPGSELSARITAVDYAPAIYNSDSGTPPDWNSQGQAAPPRPTPQFLATNSSDFVSVRDADGSIEARIMIALKPPATMLPDAGSIVGIEYETQTSSTVGLNDRGAYSSSTIYNAGDAVTYSGQIWVALTDGVVNVAPGTNSGDWTALVAQSLNNRGAYDSSATYNISDLVEYNGQFWIALANGVTGVAPGSNANDWMVDNEASPWTQPALAPVATTVIITGVNPNFAYNIRLRYVFSDGSRGGWSSLTHVVAGQVTVPLDVTNLTATQVTLKAVKLKWTKSVSPNIREYEIRQGASWASAAVVANVRTTHFQDHDLALGTYTFWVGTIDTSGNYSASPPSVTVTIAAPQGSSTLDDLADGAARAALAASGVGNGKVIEGGLAAGAATGGAQAAWSGSQSWGASFFGPFQNGAAITTSGSGTASWQTLADLEYSAAVQLQADAGASLEATVTLIAPKYERTGGDVIVTLVVLDNVPAGIAVAALLDVSGTLAWTANYYWGSLPSGMPGGSNSNQGALPSITPGVPFTLTIPRAFGYTCEKVAFGVVAPSGAISTVGFLNLFSTQDGAAGSYHAFNEWFSALQLPLSVLDAGDLVNLYALISANAANMASSDSLAARIIDENGDVIVAPQTVLSINGSTATSNVSATNSPFHGAPAAPAAGNHAYTLQFSTGGGSGGNSASATFTAASAWGWDARA